MIGRRCKARERLSRAPLIGRALRDTHTSPPLRPFSRMSFLKRCAAPRAPCERHPPKQPAPQRPPGAGGHGGRGTPGPIPNPEVKPASAEGTAGATLWETRAPPAPGARCAGSGRGGASRATGKRDPRGSPFSYAGLFWNPAIRQILKTNRSLRDGSDFRSVFRFPSSYSGRTQFLCEEDLLRYSMLGHIGEFSCWE